MGKLLSDEELFELCKRVYRLTGWKDTHSRLDDGNHTIRNEGNEVLLGTKQAPLYTSDYLLEKLPAQIDGGDNPDHATWLSLRMTRDTTYGFGFYYERTDLDAHADTPLKALLKLTLALHEAGEL